MVQKLMGKKRGMTQRFDDKGNIVVCTIIESEPNAVVQVKTKERDGYDAVQIGHDIMTAGDQRTIDRRVGKPLTGHFKKAGVASRRNLAEYRTLDGELPEVGAEFNVDIFETGMRVDVMAVSKGKGFQGLMKKNNFSGGPAAHGSGFHRHAGSTGNRSTPGRCFPGSPRPSQMGNERCTVQNLEVVAIYPEKNLLLVKGAVPGANGSMVTVSPAIKKQLRQGV